MAASNNVEFEAAKFLQKLIQESKDEPAKLATKLHVILQHMKSSGKEDSMPYQVISRAMETVISQHNLDIESLKSSRLPVSGSHAGESPNSANAGSSQLDGTAASSKAAIADSEPSLGDPFDPSRQSIGPSSGHNYYQASMGQRASFSREPESPSASDPRSQGVQNQERRDQSNLGRTTNRKLEKRKRGESPGMETHAEISQKVDSASSFVQPRVAKVNKVQLSGTSVGAVVSKQEDQTQSGVYLSENPAFAPKMLMENFPSSSSFQIDHNANNIPPPFTPSGGRPNIPEAMKNNVQDRGQSLLDVTTARGSSLGENGKSITASGKLFNEQQLKQLRAQCLVFLAFRNGFPPKPWHVEIALGISHPKEGSSLDASRPQLGGNREATQSSNDPIRISEPAIPSGRLSNVSGSYVCSPSVGQSATQFMTKEVSLPNSMENSNYQSTELPLPEESRPLLSTKSLEVDALNQMRDVSSNVKHPASSIAMAQMDSIEKRAFDHELHPPISTEDGQIMPANASPVSEDEDGRAASLLPQPKYTMLEKWISQVQKKKLQDEQNWLKKQKKAEIRISYSFERLKENVSSSEDLSAKTKSVIELKKLQLLALQQRLRGDFLSEFFKPIVSEMDQLRSFKKHRHGRRIKQIERYEQKMKEEGQKRIRERQKEFFGDIEVHKERLDDVFKAKRERLKGLNKFVKEFHKKKERAHREKIDRIQREKITLLKINDVEGYLRMVQDVKSDRVKQLLKETEKYLQKLGSKLREAKAMANFEHDGDEIQTSAFTEKNESAIENEDECDQAKHYKESNEKYYMMAHSIKEEITEQPATLQGGKLREYQMNGLRWLVSLYNNHLNGILADEMGLGKTVQVISLICYLMEAKNDRGPFLVVVPSSVLPGWDSEISFWSPAVHKIVYAGPPEERRRLFKERIVHRKFNVLLTTYEYLMNKHDRPKLSKVHWRYIIIDEGHRIKNASCKLNADLKHYQSSHRLLLTGTPLQNNLEELWALLNFLLPNIFNSSEDFSQWFNKPFQGNGDGSTDEALLSEEENLLIINRLHQVLRPFVLRRLKHKVENELPEKIERLIRCEASAYQKLLMKRVEENLGSLGNLKARSVQNSVMELRNICNHPYLSQLHAEEVDNLIPKHYLPPIVRLCGKLEMLDRLLPKLKATDHRVLFFSTMTRLLDVMEEYLISKQYRYLRLDGHTSGGDRGALIDMFNQPNSPFFIFLLSIRAGGVGVNLQAADTVIIFDTDWNPQVDLQAQARAHRIGQKKDVLVLRFETVRTVEEQVRAAAEHKLGVANQSITAGFFDNDTSAEDRREYLESLLRESKKEEAAPVLDDDALNDILARSESEIDIFESVDKQRREDELARWTQLVSGQGKDDTGSLLPLPSRLVTDDDLKAFYEAMKIHEEQRTVQAPNAGLKRKSGNTGGLNTEQYGRGKRAREVRSYEEQMTEEEFEKMCQVESPRSPTLNDRARIVQNLGTEDKGTEVVAEPSAMILPESSSSDLHLSPTHKDATPPSRRGRGRPKRAIASIPSRVIGSQVLSAVSAESSGGDPPSNQSSSGQEYSQHSGLEDPSVTRLTSPTGQSISTGSPSRSAPQRRGRRQATLIGGIPRQLLGDSGGQVGASAPTSSGRGRGRGRKSQTSAQATSGRGRRSSHVPRAITDVPVGEDVIPNLPADKSSVPVNVVGKKEDVTADHTQSKPLPASGMIFAGSSGQNQPTDESNTLSSQNASVVADVLPSKVQASMERSDISSTREQTHASGEGGRIMNPEDDKGPPGFVSASPYPSVPAPVTRQSRRSQSRTETPQRRSRKSALLATPVPDVSLGGPAQGQSKNADVRLVASMMKNMLSDSRLLKPKGTENNPEDQASVISRGSLDNVGDGKNDQALISKLPPGGSTLSAAASGLDNQASSQQNETLNGRELEGRKLLVPATKAVVLGLEGKCASGSSGVVARQYETENLDDMPAFPPGFEKFETPAAQAIDGGVVSVDAHKEPSITTEATDLVIEDRTPIKEGQIPSSGAQPVEICQDFEKNTEVLGEDHDLSIEPSSVENKLASGASETATASEIDSVERLTNYRALDRSQMVSGNIERAYVDNSTQSTSSVEEARDWDEDKKGAPSNIGLDDNDLDAQGEVGILTTGLLSSDVSASEGSSPLDKAKESSEPVNDIVTDRIGVACSNLESVPNASELLWERKPETKSEVPLLAIDESATSTKESCKETAEVNCLVGNSIQLEGDGEARPENTSPVQLVPDGGSNMVVDEAILPTTEVEACSSEVPLQSHIISQESGDTLVEGQDLGCGPESLQSESPSLDRKSALDDTSGSAEALTDVAENNDENLLEDSSMVISQTVSVDTEKGEKGLNPTEPVSAVECVEDDVTMNDDIPCSSCSNAAEADNMDVSDHDKVMSEGVSHILEASDVIGETRKELDRPDNDGSSLAKAVGDNSESETGDGGDCGQVNEKVTEHDSPSQGHCPASSSMRNREISDARERLCVEPAAGVEDSVDREKSCHVDELVPARSYESKVPLSDLPSEGHDAQMNDWQGLCQIDEIVPEESYGRNELSSAPERDPSFVMKQDDQAEEMKVCSDLPQSIVFVADNFFAGNQLASSVSTTRDPSDTKADDVEFENLNETSLFNEVIPDNLLQESIELASYASSVKQVVEPREADSATIASSEEKAEAHQTGMEVERNGLAEERSDLEIAEAHDPVIDDHGDASLADPVVPEAMTESLNISLSEKISSVVLERHAQSSDYLLIPEEKQMDSDEKLQTMQVVCEGRDASEFYTPPSSPMVVDQSKISEEEVKVNESTGDVKDSSEDYVAALHEDVKQDPSEVIGFVPEDQLKGDPMSTGLENELAFVSMKAREGSETESSQGHSVQCDGTVIENIVNADSHVVKPGATEEILRLPSEVLKELQSNDDAVSEGAERHETLEGPERRGDADCVDDVAMNSPLGGKESSELFSSAMISVPVTNDGREHETTHFDVVVDSSTAGNESAETLPLVLMNDGQSEDSSGKAEASHIDEIMMENASDENESSEILPSVKGNEGHNKDDMVNEQAEGDKTITHDEREAEDARIDDIPMDDTSNENKPLQGLPLGVIKEDQSEDNTVKEQTECETVRGKERKLDASRIGHATMKCSSAENVPSEILSSEAIEDMQSDSNVVNEQAKEHKTIMSGGCETDTNIIPEVAPDSELTGDKSLELLPLDVTMQGRTGFDSVNELNEQKEVLPKLPETIMSEGLESEATQIDSGAVSTALVINESIETLPHDEVKDGQSEWNPVIEQSEGPEPAMSEGRVSDTSHVDHVELDNASVENEMPEDLPSYVPGEVTGEGQMEDEPLNEQTEPKPSTSDVQECDAGLVSGVAITSSPLENETPETLPSDINMTNEDKSEDHLIDGRTEGLASLVSKGYESDATSGDDALIDSAVVGLESSETTTFVPGENAAASKEKPSFANDFQAAGSEFPEILTGVPGEEKQPSSTNDIQATGSESLKIPTGVPGGDGASEEQHPSSAEEAPSSAANAERTPVVASEEEDSTLGKMELEKTGVTGEGKAA
ncbi:hypothetical protein MLD38_019653 [Melastoma candidum]|uniref:Uncharacterized protein n=1 Tax=Melastoma candidum TaxID=119954 RepID=A0ACB9QXW0_9MYRT|nr:hypothetical protein MLD38_019653 [Melastoma candidum]